MKYVFGDSVPSDAELHEIGVYVAAARAQAGLARRATLAGASERLEDSLWAARAERLRARELLASGSRGPPGESLLRIGPSWRSGRSAWRTSCRRPKSPLGMMRERPRIRRRPSWAWSGRPAPRRSRNGSGHGSYSPDGSCGGGAGLGRVLRWTWSTTSMRRWLMDASHPSLRSSGRQCLGWSPGLASQRASVSPRTASSRRTWTGRSSSRFAARSP